MVSDGAGGAILIWEDSRNFSITSVDIYAQRINSDGNVNWTANGVVICNSINPQFSRQLISDGAGGAIITWQDKRMGSSEDDIYAQKINAVGITQWSANGTVICNATDEQGSPDLVSDGAGGAIITWQDKRYSGTTDYDIYAQKINAAGITQWGANGTVICNATDEQKYPDLVSDGAGGAINTWQDKRYSGTTDYDIYAQKINSAGITQWTTNGSIICNATGYQAPPQTISDGSGGAIITWTNYSNPSNYDIYTQKINSAGITQWTTNGSIICNALGNQQSFQTIGDGSGGAIITWQDSRPGTTIGDIYAQKIDAAGMVQWTINGTIICDAIKEQLSARIASDSAGGAIIAWGDNRATTTSWDIYAQKIAGTGPSITINSPSNYSVFNATAWYFNVTVSGISIHTMWYTMNMGPIHIFTDNTTVDDTEWAAFANNTLVTVMFYANDTARNQVSKSILVYFQIPPSGGSGPPDGGGNIPFSNFYIVFALLGMVSLIYLAKRKGNQ